MLNPSRLTLITFFIALTLSIGLVSVNLPLSSNAQNTALSQSGNSDSEQETKQGQTSEQDNQVVSGDMSIFSGNNIMCQSIEDSNFVDLNAFCDQGEPNGPPDEKELSQIIIQVVRSGGFTPIDKPDLMASFHLKDMDTNVEITKNLYWQNRTHAVSFVIPVDDRYSLSITPGSDKFIYVLEGLPGITDCTIQFLKCEGTKGLYPTLLQLKLIRF